MKRSLPPIVISVVTRLVVITLVLSVAVAIFMFMVSTAGEVETSDSVRSVPQIPVMRVGEVDVRQEWSGFGTAAAKDTADISAEVVGVVQPLPAITEVGRSVRAGDDGDVLVRLDERDYVERIELINVRLDDLQTQVDTLLAEEQGLLRRLEIAQQEVELSQRDYERLVELQRRDGARQAEIDRAEQALRQLERAESILAEEVQKRTPRRQRLEVQRRGLEAELRLAQRDLERCVVRSPIDGVLQRVAVRGGERVAPGQMLLRVVSLRRMEVPLRLPSSARSSVRVGDAALLTTTGPVAHEWHGQISRIAPEDDEQTRTFTVFVEVEQDPASRVLLTPGQFVNGTVRAAASERRMVVPRRSVSEGQVLLVRASQLERHAVDVAYYVRSEFPQFGLAREDYWAVLETALPEESLLVVNPATVVPIGAEVEPVMIGMGVAGRGTGDAARDEDGRGP